MKCFNESQIKKCEISKPDFSKRNYNIIHNDDIFGTIEEDQDKGTLASLTTAKGSYTIKRCGFFNPYITIRKKNFETNESIAFLNLRSETTITIDGNLFTFKLLNLWKNQWCWTNEKHQVLITIKPIIAGTIKGDIEISKEAFHYTQLELLTLIGAYFMIKYQNETDFVQ